jgi:hypothetical protein
MMMIMRCYDGRMWLTTIRGPSRRRTGLTDPLPDMTHSLGYHRYLQQGKGNKRRKTVRGTCCKTVEQPNTPKMHTKTSRMRHRNRKVRPTTSPLEILAPRGEHARATIDIGRLLTSR